MTAPRTGRRRRVASALRHLLGGRRPVTAAGEAVSARLRDGGVLPADADLAEALARLELEPMIPPEIACALCAALLPLLHSPDRGSR